MQVDAEYEVSRKAAEAARAAEEAARKLNNAAEDVDSRFHVRYRVRNFWRDIKRAAPLVSGLGWMGGLACERRVLVWV